MLASTLAPWFGARGLHYAWIVAALTFLCALCNSAAMSIPGVMIVAISKDLGWSVGDISYAAGLRLMLFGAIAPFAGAFLIRYGVVRMMVISIALLVVGLILSMTMTAKWQLWVGMGVLLGVAPGMTALVVSVTVAARWFTARRGLVVGLLGASTATGQLAFLPVAARIADAYGWRAAFVPAIIAVALGGVLYALFARNDPSELGLSRYGEDVPAAPPAMPAGSAVALSLNTLAGAARNPVFWVLFFSFAICGLSTFGLIQTHFVPFCADFGVATVTAAGMLAVMGIFDFVGTIGSGWLTDRFDSRWLLTWYYTLRGLSLVWLPYSDFSLYGLSIFSIFFGLDFVATIPPTVKLTVQAFGRDRGPVVFGWIFAGHQLGAAVMAAAAGASRDALATYLPAFVVGGLASISAGLLMFALIGARNPARPQPA